MKRLFAASGLLMSLFIFAQAQKTTDTAAPNFAGTWEADMARSKPPEGGRGPKVTGRTMTVTQDAKTITVVVETKTDGDMPVPSSNRTYNLDGSESTGELKMMQMSAPAKLNAHVADGGKLDLNLNASVESPRGTMEIVVKESWELTDGGKTLKVHQTRTTPRGSEESDWIYVKK